MTRRSLLGLALAMILVAAGWFFLTERPLSVPVATAEQSVPVRVYGLGTIEARILSQVGFEVGAALTDLEVDSGDIVTKGQILARLHPSEQEARVARTIAAVAAAKATLSKAEASVQRARAVLAQRETANQRKQELVGRSITSEQSAQETQRDVEVAAADLSVAQSDVEVTRAQIADAEGALQYETTILDHHTLRAPFDAVIVSRHVEAGTVVRAGEPIFTLMDPKTIWTLAYIDEERAGALAVGQKAEIRLRSLPHDVFTGTLARIGIESDRVNEERRVWITCDQCPAQVFLGEQAEVKITTATLSNAILIPETAITGFDGHQGRVWIAENGRARQIDMIFGSRTEDARVEVVGDLPEAAQIISAPVKGLSDGRMVRMTSGSAP